MHQLPQPTTSSFNRDDKNGIQRNGRSPATLIAFATNIELETQDFTFVERKNEVDKLPYMLSPNGKGDLLNYAGENIAGLNSAQLYVKVPGSRTSIHPENSALASFNHNIGPGDCVRYCVPLK
ncbi:hypothetical protein GCK72_012458 [Caenorhabditis remanei]|uniref:JmjC domain-containing protein n=1 Tax=Caenorhabditis remanei TaxID=31234 RepID=A0A6A5GN77_CAERE|nr:hypothetical protein GCK72_012458 [Caenorhabditis remanei]KAF1756005.1 hypothetical protein GCK72_012458 [Caenorhabditis remanei]